MNWELFDWSVLGPPLAAGLLVLTVHVPLGMEVLKRGIIFIDLAIAQIAGLGVIAANAAGWAGSTWKVQSAAVGTALCAALALNWTERRWPRRQEPLIGILFVLAATGSILLLAENPHGAEHLKDLLAGQILWVTWNDLLPIAALYAVLLGSFRAFGSRFGPVGFYLTFALAVTAAVQLVGVYLVFASLIIPALATDTVTGRVRLVSALLVGSLAYLLGITLSGLLDLPTGALVVWVMALVGVLAACILKPLRDADGR